MSAFVALLIPLVVFVWSTAFLLPYVRRHGRELDRGGASPGRTETMKHWARRARGVVGTGTVWGLFGAVLGAAFGVAANGIDGLPALSVVWRTAFGAGMLGALMGAAFATILTLMDGRRTFDQLSAKRAGVWGAAAGCLLPIGVLALRGAPLTAMLGETLVAGGLFGAAGAGMAAGTVLLARGADTH